MAAPPTASRARTQRSAPDDDALTVRALQFSEWARRNARWIIIGVVAVAIAAAIFFWYRLDQAQREERAAVQFLRLEQTVQSGNAALATRDLNAFIARHEGTAEADQARIVLARLYLQQGQAAQAVPVLRPFADRMGSSPVAPQGALLLGAAQAQAGQRDAAIATFLRVAEQAPFPFERESALTEAAILREATGNFAGAAELYRRLVEAAEEGSLDRSVYEMRLAEVEARVGSAPAPAAAGGR